MKRDMTLPNGVCFHVPIKNERQLSLKLLRKYNEQNPKTPIILPTITPEELDLIPPPSAIPLGKAKTTKTSTLTSTTSKTVDFSKDPDFQKRKTRKS